jgi:hypothetical protein
MQERGGRRGEGEGGKVCISDVEGRRAASLN